MALLSYDALSLSFLCIHFQPLFFHFVSGKNLPGWSGDRLTQENGENKRISSSRGRKEWKVSHKREWMSMSSLMTIFFFFFILFSFFALVLIMWEYTQTAGFCHVTVHMMESDSVLRVHRLCRMWIKKVIEKKCSCVQFAC